MRILILTNHQLGLYKFRCELLEILVREGHRVYVAVPEGEFTKELEDIGVRLISNKYLNSRGTNPIEDIRLLNYYKSMIKHINPDLVLTYTIKPNVYGGIACARYKIPNIVNITGLGKSIQNSIFTKKKIKMRAGKTDKAVSFKDEKLFVFIEKFVLEAGYRGQIDIDIFEINDKYYISEVNPRFGGGYPHAYECGVDHMKLILNNLNGKANEKNIGAYEEGIYMMKYSEVKIVKM